MVSAVWSASLTHILVMMVEHVPFTAWVKYSTHVECGGCLGAI